jgi:signal transduction histidine kinase
VSEPITLEGDDPCEVYGTGLGLPIVRERGQAHGVRVWAESHLGNGSTFHATIPFDARRAR